MKQTTGRKDALPCYYHAHVAHSGWLSDHGQTKGSHIIDHFRPTPLNLQLKKELL
jgi:hypothetical protein